MAAKLAHASPAETAALLRERLERLSATLDSLDQDQLATMNELVAMLERLATLLDETGHH
jgi:predicted HTH domain antitoxin